MEYSQQRLNELWRTLKGRPVSDYAEARITADSDLLQELELDALVHSGSLAGTGKTISFTRGRANPYAEWGMWEEGYSTHV